VRTGRTKTGFAGVHKASDKPGGDFKAHGAGRKYLGTLRTAAEAALVYARYLGPEASASAAAATRAAEAPPPTEAEVRQQAAAEGLTLVPARTRNGHATKTRFKHVTEIRTGHFQVISGHGPDGTLGNFRTDYEGALCYARFLGPVASAIQAGLQQQVIEQMSPEEAEQLAAVEGLSLIKSSSGSSGYKGVYENVSTTSSARKPYSAMISNRVVGSFDTAHEAALAYSRALGPEACAAEAAKNGEPMALQEAEQLAASEGLILIKSSACKRAATRALCTAQVRTPPVLCTNPMSARVASSSLSAPSALRTRGH
jgi:hypothetical protein